MTYFCKHGTRVGLEINFIEVTLHFVIFSLLCNTLEEVQLDGQSMPWSLKISLRLCLIFVLQRENGGFLLPCAIHCLMIGESS